MTIPKASELRFAKIDTSANNQLCNMCGQPIFAAAYIATAPIADDATYDLFMCTEACVRAFVSFGCVADEYIEKGIKSALALHNSQP